MLEFSPNIVQLLVVVDGASHSVVRSFSPFYDSLLLEYLPSTSLALSRCCRNLCKTPGSSKIVWKDSFGKFGRRKLSSTTELSKPPLDAHWRSHCRDNQYPSSGVSAETFYPAIKNSKIQILMSGPLIPKTLGSLSRGTGLISSPIFY